MANPLPLETNSLTPSGRPCRRTRMTAPSPMLRSNVSIGAGSSLVTAVSSPRGAAPSSRLSCGRPRVRRRTSHATVEVGHGPRSGAVPLLALRELEPRVDDQAVDLAVEVATARHASPHRIEPVLPRDDPRVRGEPVLDEDELALGLEDALHLQERKARLVDRTERPRHHDGVDA